jgi:uncharacterized membrane-anchored protein YhcB (DUF1043 family)
MFPFLQRLAEKGLRRELADVQAELDAERRKLKVAETEIDSLAAVIARDRERVYAETAEAAKRVADATVSVEAAKRVADAKAMPQRR